MQVGSESFVSFVAVTILEEESADQPRDRARGRSMSPWAEKAMGRRLVASLLF
jgi:hypothetical protein